MTAVAPALRRGLQATGVVIAVTVSAALSSTIVGATAQKLSGNRMAPWILGRAAGVCSYFLLVALVLLGLFLSHPWRTRIRRPANATRIRLHFALAVFTLAFTTLHVVVLATDKYANVGWAGALLPMHSVYRPLPTTLGVIGAWAGLLAGLTAAFAGHLPKRLWWPIHKVAGIAFVLVWVHGVMGGGDTPALLVMYIATAALVVIVGASRYIARQPADLVAELEMRS